MGTEVLSVWKMKNTHYFHNSIMDTFGDLPRFPWSGWCSHSAGAADNSHLTLFLKITLSLSFLTEKCWVGHAPSHVVNDWGCCLVTNLCLALLRPHGLLPGSPVHRISQARILEWVAISFSQPRDLPDPGIKPTSLALAGRFFTTEPLMKPSMTDARVQKTVSFLRVRQLSGTLFF